jgi:hypothetical protein
MTDEKLLLEEMLKDDKLVSALHALMENEYKEVLRRGEQRPLAEKLSEEGSQRYEEAQIEFHNLNELEKDFIVAIANDDDDYYVDVKQDDRNRERYTVVLGESVGAMF